MPTRTLIGIFLAILALVVGTQLLGNSLAKDTFSQLEGRLAGYPKADGCSVFDEATRLDKHLTSVPLRDAAFFEQTSPATEHREFLASQAQNLEQLLSLHRCTQAAGKKVAPPGHWDEWWMVAHGTATLHRKDGRPGPAIEIYVDMWRVGSTLLHDTEGIHYGEKLLREAGESLVDVIAEASPSQAKETVALFDALVATTPSLHETMDRSVLRTLIEHGPRPSFTPFSGFREIGFAQSVGVFLPVYDRYVGTRAPSYIEVADKLNRLQTEIDAYRHPVFGSIRGRLVAFEQLRARLVAMLDLQRVALRTATFARTHGACPTTLQDVTPADLVLPLGPPRLEACTIRAGQGNLEVSVRGR